MFVLRTFSFIVLIGIFLTTVLWHSEIAMLGFAAFATAAAFAAVFEMLSMLENLQKPSCKWITATAAALTVAVVFFGKPVLAGLIPAFLVVFLWVRLLAVRENQLAAVERAVNSAAALLLVVCPLLFLALLYLTGERVNYEGRSLLLYLVLVTKAGDTGAYLTGTLSNKLSRGKNHPIAPVISPKKSWEGTCGGMLLSIIVSVIVWRYVKPDCGAGMDLLTAISVGAVLFVGGFAGDLAESALKRACKVKDSAKYIPGMGGVFDVVDSLMLNAPIFYFIHEFIK